MCYETGWRRKKPKLADQKRARGGSLRSHLECHEAPLSPETPHFLVKTRRYPEKREKLNMKDQEATVSNCHTWSCTKSVQIRINVSFHFGWACEGLWDRHDLQVGSEQDWGLSHSPCLQIHPPQSAPDKGNILLHCLWHLTRCTSFWWGFVTVFLK